MKALMYKLQEIMEIGGTKRDIAFLVISGIALLFSIFEPMKFSTDPAWVAIILCGIPIIMEAIIGLVTEFDIKADVLVSLALIASVIIGEDFAAGEVAFIMQIGGLLEELTVAKARAGIEKLVKLTPQTACVIDAANGTQEKIIPAAEVQRGDILRVRPGETVPVDGVIIAGQTSINQSVMTGESLPVDKTVGDEVSSGTVNQFGAFEMQATKVGEDSSIQRMIRLVQTADAGKAKIVGLADRWATWIVVIALTAATLTWLVTGEIIRSVTILVVFCPCALVLATPTAIMAAIGNATKYGFLVREGDALERLARVSRVCFDKTGTLTLGTPKVVAVETVNEDYSTEELYRLAAIAEKTSEHPLGKALVGCYVAHTSKGAHELAKPESFAMLPGRGVRAVIDGHTVLAGNTKLLQENGISLGEGAGAGTAVRNVASSAENAGAVTGQGNGAPSTEVAGAVMGQENAASSVENAGARALQLAQNYLNQGCTIIYLAVDNEAVGIIAMADVLRQNMPQVLKNIGSIGVDAVLLTGDNEKAAGFIASSLNIKNVKANCLPEDKLNYIAESQSNKQQVCMVGDGINDAPALKKAFVGIAMGGVGSDIAVDAADIALVDDKIEELPHLLALSKRMMTTIKLNITFSMTLNFIAITLAITGILTPVVGALVHNAGSVLVIINSALLLKWRYQSDN